MSVKQAERSQGELTVIVKAKENAAYTLQVTDNTNNFPKHHRFSTATKLQTKAFEIVEYLVEANEFFPKTAEELEHRRLLQRKAMAACRSSLTMIDICATKFDIKKSTVEYWTKQLWNVRNLTVGWLKKDEERYKDLLQ